MTGKEHPVLRTDRLTVRFGGHIAVNNVSAEFDRGTLTAIVGPNGAGKTTFFNLISGQLKSTSGNVFLNEENITSMPASERTHRGLARAFQLTNLFSHLTVRENVRLAVQSRAGIGLNIFTMADRHRELNEKADHFLARVGLFEQADEIAATLPHGGQRKLEVALMLALEHDVLMFDEPTAGMSVDEVPVILDLIHEIKADKTKTVMLVEHKMDVIHSLADRIIVLHNGFLVADGDPKEVMTSPIVQEAYLGTGAADHV